MTNPFKTYADSSEGVSPGQPAAPTFTYALPILVIANLVIGFSAFTYLLPNTPSAVVAAVGRALCIPMALVLLLQIVPGFRNSDSRKRIAFWSSVMVSVSLVGPWIQASDDGLREEALQITFATTGDDRDAVVYYSETTEKDGLRFRLGDDKPLTSRVVDKYPDGRMLYEATYVDGRPTGTVTTWHDNGQKEYEANYLDGKLHGMATEWYPSGQQSHRLGYVDGKRHGMDTTWYENGQKKSELNYRNGQGAGVQSWWYENGTKWFEACYQDGEIVDTQGSDCPQ